MSCLNVSKFRNFFNPSAKVNNINSLPSISNNTASMATMRKNKCMISEVVIPDGENSGQALNRFTQSVKNANLVYEVKRRKNFENKQDRIKRKRREQVFKKRAEKFGVKRFDELSSGLLSITPFQDMFENPDELFNENGLFDSSKQNDKQVEDTDNDTIVPMRVPEPAR